jgi:LysM repeat protein
MCPYLGLKDDPATSLAYPSMWNHCHRAKPLDAASLDHQRKYCLTSAHTACPQFLAAEATPMPAEMRSQENGRRGRRPLWQPVTAVLALVILVAVVVWQGIARGFFAFPARPESSTSTPTWTELPPPATATATSLPATDGTPVTPAPSLTPTKTSLPSPTIPIVYKLTLETPLGLNKQFMIHRMVEGESIDRLASKYGTTAALIQAINFYLASPLLIGTPVVIPLGRIDIQGLPSFEPQMVVGSMTLEEFAQSQSVDASTLSYYNALPAAYRLLPGDWLLVPRQKIIPLQPTATP